RKKDMNATLPSTCSNASPPIGISRTRRCDPSSPAVTLSPLSLLRDCFCETSRYDGSGTSRFRGTDTQPRVGSSTVAAVAHNYSDPTATPSPMSAASTPTENPPRSVTLPQLD